MEGLFKYLVSFAQSMLSMLKILIKSKYSTNTAKRQSDKCLILGNGPSVLEDIHFLKKQDLKLDLLCLNKFPDTEYFEILKPNHFVLVSTEYWKKGTIASYNEVRDKIIKALIEKTTWPLNLFLPADARHHQWFIDMIEANENLKIIYYNTTPIEGGEWISNKLFDLRLGSPRPHNVLIPSILNSIWMGYKEIGVIGADHSWLETLTVTDQNEALLNQKHFYDADKSKSLKMTKNGSGYRKLHEILEKFMLTFKAYFVLDSYARSRSIKLFNCSSKSYIDGLERMTLEEFIK